MALTGESIWKKREPVQRLTRRSNMYVTRLPFLHLEGGGHLREAAGPWGRDGKSSQGFSNQEEMRHVSVSLSQVAARKVGLVLVRYLS